MLKTRFICRFDKRGKSRLYDLLYRAVRGLGMQITDLKVTASKPGTHTVFDAIRAIAVMQTYCDEYVADMSNIESHRKSTKYCYDNAIAEIKRIAF